MISTELWEKISTEAQLAPSAHNTQPWSLQKSEDALFLLEDPSRRLHAADPTLKDHFISLGCYIEGLDLILRDDGLCVQSILRVQETPRLQYRLNLELNAQPDVLRNQIVNRKTFRGVFEPAPTQKLMQMKKVLGTDELVILDDQMLITKIADLACSAGVACNRISGVQSEFFHWLRLSPSHPLYNQDGLNDKALGLSRLEALAAQWLLNPQVYRTLDKVGCADFVNSEKKQICSSSAIVVLTRSNLQEDSIAFGRRLFRVWLQLTELGFAACPQSSLIDDPEAKEHLQRLMNNSQNASFVFRIGIAPHKSQPPRVRRSY